MQIGMDDITVKNLEEIAPYTGPHAIPGIRFRPAREALGVRAWGMNVIELDPACENYPAHRHTNDGQEEVYVVLRGSVVLLAADTERTLKEGDFVRVAPDVDRKFVTRKEGATLLALGGTPGQAYETGMGEATK
jgi:quercetin dioxygenase-like cupin family protein